ncbi:hypothetical protein [Hyphomicrobium sp. CS1BSMeth3]|uniref:hypothetical protein n=1 Tax=Hyphomicrobium sp. CS1BSMeth3 TaxID=1892844 RepID=UPI001160AC80|nr:hypothetical protein [Hyphomicrobium sp. CS1BSMeth3]
MQIVGIAIAALVALVVTASAALAIWTIWTAWRSPRKVLELHEDMRREDEAPGTHHPLLQNRIIVGLSILGYGVFAFGGINSALFWMPDSWGAFDDDGRWTSYRTMIAITVALWGAIAFTYPLREYCRLKIKDQWRQAASDRETRLPEPR